MLDRQEFIQSLSKGVMIGDGAIGSELYARGATLERCVERLNIQSPVMVETLHRDYIAAGSRMIVTNTFGVNRYSLANIGFENELHPVLREGVRLAKNAAGDSVLVAGSIGPLPLFEGEPLDKNAWKAAFAENVEILTDSGVDLIIFETFVDIGQLAVAVETARGMTDMPVMAQMAFDSSGLPAGGGSVEAFVDKVRSAGADVIGANCGAGVLAVRNAARRLLPYGMPVSAFMNAGFAEKVESRNLYVAPDNYIAAAAAELVQDGVSIIGGCCGTTPATIRAIVDALGKIDSKDRRISLGKARPAAEQKPEVPEKEYVEPEIPKGILVELDPPKKPDVSKIIETAHALAGSGITALTLADNPLASVRVDVLMAASLLKREAAVEVIPHLTGRDRNRIALQSTILGAHVAGLRSLLCVTGDPVRMYNETNTSGVFDVTSIGLVKLVSEFNDGTRGGDIRTSFSIGVALNPNVRNHGGQIKKLKRKIEAGAQFALTQPVYDYERFDRLMDAAEEEGIAIPVFAGVMPLVSSRNAEFLHNEVPGITIPDKYRERLASYSEKDDQRKAGRDIAMELVCQLSARCTGFYFVTPWNKAEYVLPLIDEGLKVLAKDKN